MTTSKLATGAFAILLSTQVTSCATGSPPTKQLALTQSSIESAEAAGAAIHAAEPLQAAQEKLEFAKKQIDKKKYDKAIQNLQLAKAHADTAKTAATAKTESQSLTAKAERLQLEAEMREKKLRAQLAELEELKALQAKNTDRGMVLTLGDVLFDTGESTLRSGAIKNLDKVAAFLNKYPDRTVQIEGHTDSIGDEELNFTLSRERAFSVRSTLEEKGIASSRIVARGLGENDPIASNDVADGRQQNRRVELIFNHVEDTVVSDIDL